MNEVKEKYLPIGSVCLLKGGTKRVMVTGFCAVDNTDKEKMYDYSGCMYPEGFLSSDQTALFDHEQIEKVFHIGFIDDEETNFKSQLKEIVNKLNNVVSAQSESQVPEIKPVQETTPQPVVVLPTEPVITETVKLDETKVEDDLKNIPPIGPGL